MTCYSHLPKQDPICVDKTGTEPAWAVRQKCTKQISGNLPQGRMLLIVISSAALRYEARAAVEVAHADSGLVLGTKMHQDFSNVSLIVMHRAFS